MFEHLLKHRTRTDDTVRRIAADIVAKTQQLFGGQDADFRPCFGHPEPLGVDGEEYFERVWTFMCRCNERSLMSSRLQNGDLFPDLTIEVVAGGRLAIPRDLAGSYAVALFYRGSWCPYCCAQLAAFSRARERFAEIGIKIVALSVDDRTTSEALVEKMRLNFPIGFGVKADEISETTGAYLGEGSAYLQSTGFVLDKSGRILTAVYSSGAIGRLVPDDVAGFVRYIESHEPAKTLAEARP